MESNVCEFEFNGIKCLEQITPGEEYTFNSKKITEFGIARCKKLCPRHMNAIVNDNIKRFNKDMEIPTDIVFLKDPSNSSLWANIKFKNISEKEVKLNGN